MLKALSKLGFKPVRQRGSHIIVENAEVSREPMKRATQELTERKKAELQLIASLTLDATVAAEEKLATKTSVKSRA